MKKLIASDMDGTLIPLNDDPIHKCSIRSFADAINEESALCLAYVTGRHLELALKGIAEHQLPIPDYLSGDVGTTLYEYGEGKWVPNKEYQDLMQTRLGGGRGEDIDALLNPFEFLTLQESERQSLFKRSFYTPPLVSDSEIESIRHVLSKAGLRVNLITSEDAFGERGLLDVLPQNVAKDTAVVFIQTQCKIDSEQTVFSGDSGNDVKVFEQGIQSTLVGNAEASVQATVNQLIEKESKLNQTIYRASGFYAAGVLEGVKHFGIL